MKSVNGWDVIDDPNSALLHKWLVPGTKRYLLLRRGSAGFLLVHNAMFFHDEVERLDLGVWDDWGYAKRDIRGGSVPSNHGSGTAEDLNATRHPHHVPIHDTFTPKQVRAIRARLKFYHGLIDWGGDWRPENVDGMHFEIAPGTTMSQCEKRARDLMDSPRGIEILKMNPSQPRVIRS